MSAKWKGSLLNTGTDVFIDSTLLVLIIGAYTPQISRLRNETSTQGISPYYILFNTLFSNAQLSYMLLLAAYAWPNSSRPVIKEINEGSLKGLEAFGGILGILKVFVQWLCSVAVLFSFAAATQDDDQSGQVISVVAFVHTAIILVPTFAIALPGPAEHRWGPDILMALIGMSDEKVAPCCVMLQFLGQLWETRARSGDPGA